MSTRFFWNKFIMHMFALIIKRWKRLINGARNPTCHATRLFDSVQLKDITDIDLSASYLDLHVEIGSEVRLRTKFYDKRDDFNLLL